MSTPYTCISCRVAFADGDIQRQHYKTDWHRYNLKRKVALLPPVSAEEFQKRVLEQREKNEEESKDTSTFCKICRKAFASEKAFTNHLNSKKHKENFTNADSENEETSGTNSISEPVKPKELKPREKVRPEYLDDIEEDSDIEEVDSDEWDEDLEEISEDNPILRNNCLFCAHHSKTFTKNLKHMSVEHSFFIPDLEYVVDLRGLLLHLGEKVCKYFMCLWCNLSGRGFYSLEAAQTHMRDKGHCKVKHEGSSLVEFEPYYNYSVSYPDHEEAMDIDEEIDNLDLDGSDFQLTLPSGATIGHRSLFRYYKQNFGSNEVVPVKKSKINKLMSTYRALGWKESDKHSAERKARDIKIHENGAEQNVYKIGLQSQQTPDLFQISSSILVLIC